jgi:hypothetical protein
MACLIANEWKETLIHIEKARCKRQEMHMHLLGYIIQIKTK